MFLGSADCVLPCLFACVESLLLVWHQVPCLYVCFSVCRIIPIGVTPGAMSVHLLVCGVIAIGVTPGAMSVRLLVCGVIAIGVTPGAMSVCMFVCLSVWSHCY